MTTAALIVAAGRGVRAGGAIPKQFAPLQGRPLLHHSIKSFYNSELIDKIKVVIQEETRGFYDDSAAGMALSAPCIGGATRQQSVRNGLEALAAESAPDRVLIHDGARPFVSPDLIGRVTTALEAGPAAIPALPVTDTLKEAEGGLVVATPERSRYWRAQTPQGFHFEAILAAHRQFDGEEMTDDAALAERAGLGVRLVDGDEANIKVTTPEDMARLSAGGGGLARVGMGYDVHRLGGGDHVMLCGVKIPHDQGLIGHSDADVALHALTDALLGAVGAGDIGRHFPPSDPQWKGAPSHIFVEKAVELINEAGGSVNNADITIICEAPKVTPYAALMGEQVAVLLGVGQNQVNVKATTTEKLGFTGRGEGIAAQAAVTVVTPLMGGA